MSTANTGIRYVTVEAVVAPTIRMFRRWITKASPVPSAPSASTAASTRGDSAVGSGGAPATTGATIASWAAATISCAADRDSPDRCCRR